jgi:hypothetical protein
LSFLFDFYFNRKIRASEFAKLAADTICSPSWKYLVVIIEFQDVCGTEMDTDAASFAPFRIYDMRF